MKKKLLLCPIFNEEKNINDFYDAFYIIFTILCFISAVYFVLAKIFLKIGFQEKIAAILIINLFSFL